MMDSLSRGVELAKTRADLHALINDLSEDDSVLMIVGYRELIDGKEVSSVKTLPFNVHSFEVMGLVEVARRRFRDEYEGAE